MKIFIAPICLGILVWAERCCSRQWEEEAWVAFQSKSPHKLVPFGAIVVLAVLSPSRNPGLSKGKETGFRVSLEWPWGSHIASLNSSAPVSRHSASATFILCLLLFQNLQTFCVPSEVLIRPQWLREDLWVMKSLLLSFDLDCKPCVQMERWQLSTAPLLASSCLSL